MSYIVITIINLSIMMSRLDSIITGHPGTIHYTEPIRPQNPEYPYVLLPLDARAESVLTPEEWESRLATMPIEFLPPDPLTP